MDDRPHADGFLGFKERMDANRGFSDAHGPHATSMSSWNQNASHRPLPPTPHPMTKSMLERLEIDLIRQNGMMRQSISLNRKLYYRVSLRLVSQIRQLASVLGSVVSEANLLIEQANNDWRQYAASVAKEEEQEEAEPERRCTGPELVDWFESEGRICSITGGLMFRLRDSDITLSSETASMVQSDKPSDCARRPATQFFIEYRNPLNSAPVDQVDSHKEKGKGMQGHTWPYVEPLQITRQQCEPVRDGDAAHSGPNVRRRFAMLHYERQYYEKLVKEVRARFLPTIRHQIREIHCVLHEFGVEEDRLRDLLQEQIRLRTPEDPGGCG
ncbi:hypothetical protein ACHAPM_011683 [Fusarium culmorum]